MITPIRRPFAAVAMFLLLGPGATPLLHAQTGGFVIDLPEVRNYVALAVGVVPDYIGSDDYTGGVAPAGLIKFGESERYARLIATDLQVNLLDRKDWSFGPAINYRFARDDVDDNVVDLMRDIDGTVEVGLFGGWTWIADEDPRHRFSASAEFLHDAGDEHDGYLLTGSVKYFKPVARPLTLSIGATLTYGSDDYTQTYFGVDAVDSARSGLQQFNADGGLRDLRIPLLAVWSFNQSWHLSGGVIYSRVLGDAADSPLTDQRGSKNTYYTGIGVAYAW